MELGHAAQADGRWRLYAFAGPEDPMAPDSGLSRLCGFLAQSPSSPILRYTPNGADVDATIDVRAILQQPHRELDIEHLPGLLLPRKGALQLVDYEKVFCPDFRKARDIFAMRGIDRTNGCLLIVRPDQYVAHVLPLNDHEALSAFFDGFMVQQG
jgi:phenol 2-monooxygenase